MEKTNETELGKLLRGMGVLLSCYWDSGRTESRIYMLRALQTEADMVCCKLSRMRSRWSQFLPFKEAIDVRFDEWVNEVDGWINLLTLNPQCLTSGFVLDLIDRESYELGDELKKSVPEICTKVDKKLCESVCDWEKTAYGNLDELKDELSRERTKACERLTCLKNELNELEEFFNSELKGKPPMRHVFYISEHHHPGRYI